MEPIAKAQQSLSVVDTVGEQGRLQSLQEATLEANRQETRGSINGIALRGTVDGEPEEA